MLANFRLSPYGPPLKCIYRGNYSQFWFWLFRPFILYLKRQLLGAGGIALSHRERQILVDFRRPSFKVFVANTPCFFFRISCAGKYPWVLREFLHLGPKREAVTQVSMFVVSLRFSGSSSEMTLTHPWGSR